VRRLGGKNSKERTPLQTLTARYRQGYDLSPSVRLAADAPGRRQVDNARMLALYQMATDDAVQAMVAAKLHYNYWRPITAIRNGDRDENEATQPDSSLGCRCCRRRIFQNIRAVIARPPQSRPKF
jgi:hypothetical protein